MRGVVLSLLLALGGWAFDNVDAKGFAKLLKGKDVLLLDVRTPAEFTQGHIEGANLIPIQLFRYLFLGGKGIKDRTILVYCRSGNRSVHAAQELERWGVKRIYNLRGGIVEWQGAGLPLVK
ncbi:MAG: rhodanese-like domain-containing protein [Nitratiruptor sp.]|nr:rhodanese-like domain-containing protein [Nitratiruptor sp.]NPA83970.1 rhodanese-like domain-containing protein [Campylobacterota bacterium]